MNAKLRRKIIIFGSPIIKYNSPTRITSPRINNIRLAMPSITTIAIIFLPNGQQFDKLFPQIS